MITSISHRAIKAYFFEGKPLPTGLKSCEEALCYWLTVLHAVESPKDFSFSGTSLKRSNPGFRYVVEDLGVFTFVIKERNIQNLDFKQA